jgi:hypothetical protein
VLKIGTRNGGEISTFPSLNIMDEKADFRTTDFRAVSSAELRRAAEQVSGQSGGLKASSSPLRIVEQVRHQWTDSSGCCTEERRLEELGKMFDDWIDKKLNENPGYRFQDAGLEDNSGGVRCGALGGRCAGEFLLRFFIELYKELR